MVREFYNDFGSVFVIQRRKADMMVRKKWNSQSGFHDVIVYMCIWTLIKIELIRRACFIFSVLIVFMSMHRSRICIVDVSNPVAYLGSHWAMKNCSFGQKKISFGHLKK